MQYERGGLAAAREEEAWAAAKVAADAKREQPVAGYKSPRVRGQVLQWWLVAGIFVDVAIAGLSALHLGLLEERSLRNRAAFEELTASDQRLALVSIAMLVVFIVTAAFFMAWFNRVYKNLPALGCPDRRWGTGATIWSWFIPIAAFIIPKQIANDVWRCSAAPKWTPGDVWRSRPVPLWVHFWWFLFIVGSLLGNASARIYADGADLDAERTSTILDMAAAPVYVVCAALAWLFVARVNDGQEERRDEEVEPPEDGPASEP